MERPRNFGASQSISSRGLAGCASGLLASKVRLGRSLPSSEIRGFLASYPSSPIRGAAAMRNERGTGRAALAQRRWTEGMQAKRASIGVRSRFAMSPSSLVRVTTSYCE
eukprot:scaffold159996_cov32-Tisochrysis_lutea.AAC.1